METLQWSKEIGGNENAAGKAGSIPKECTVRPGLPSVLLLDSASGSFRPRSIFLDGRATLARQ